MIVLLVWLAVIGGVATYDINEWKYVGYHECKRVGYLTPEKVTVYPAQVKGESPYILFKQKNLNGTYKVACVND
jgi:hypothetical protein